MIKKKAQFQSKQQQNMVIVSQQKNISSRHYQQYKEFILKLPQQKFHEYRKMLTKKGFFHNSRYSFDFNKKIIKANQESIMYQIQYGNYRHHLTVLMLEFQLDQFCKKSISWGSFGKVWELEIKGEKFAVKQIQSQTNCMQIQQKILREVFITKFASALQIGPKFSRFQQYDILKLQDSSFFLMQRCFLTKSEDNSDHIQSAKIKQKQLVQDIRESISILHQFKIVHLDVKPSNVVWSAQHNKYLLIDYGFSRFISQKCGQLTLINFLGTFSYCYKSMKNAYFSNKQQLLDLYFNDIYFLKQMNKANNQMTQDNEIIRNPFMTKKALVKTKNQNMNNEYWNCFCEIICLKYLIFSQKAQILNQFIKKKVKLYKCIRKILYEQLNKNSDVDLIFLKQIYQQFCLRKQQIQQYTNSNEKQIDTLLSQKLMSYYIKQNKKYIFSLDHLEAIIMNSNHRIWKKPFYMERIFTLLFFDEPNIQEVNKKKKIIYILHFFQTHLQVRSPSIRFIQILIMFRQYFERQKNISILQQISAIFCLLRNAKQCYLTNQILCKLIFNNIQELLKGIKNLFNTFFLGLATKIVHWQWNFIQLYQSFHIDQKNQKMVSICKDIFKISYDLFNKQSLSSQQELLKKIQQLKMQIRNNFGSQNIFYLCEQIEKILQFFCKQIKMFTLPFQADYSQKIENFSHQFLTPGNETYKYLKKIHIFYDLYNFQVDNWNPIENQQTIELSYEHIDPQIILNRSPILSQILSIWHIGVYINDDQKLKQIMELNIYMNSPNTIVATLLDLKKNLIQGLKFQSFRHFFLQLLKEIDLNQNIINGGSFQLIFKLFNVFNTNNCPFQLRQIILFRCRQFIEILADNTNQKNKNQDYKFITNSIQQIMLILQNFQNIKAQNNLKILKNITISLDKNDTSVKYRFLVSHFLNCYILYQEKDSKKFHKICQWIFDALKSTEYHFKFFLLLNNHSIMKGITGNFLVKPDLQQGYMFFKEIGKILTKYSFKNNQIYLQIFRLFLYFSQDKLCETIISEIAHNIINFETISCNNYQFFFISHAHNVKFKIITPSNVSLAKRSLKLISFAMNKLFAKSHIPAFYKIQMFKSLFAERENLFRYKNLRQQNITVKRCCRYIRNPEYLQYIYKIKINIRIAFINRILQTKIKLLVDNVSLIHENIAQKQ